MSENDIKLRLKLSERNLKGMNKNNIVIVRGIFVHAVEHAEYTVKYIILNSQF